MKLLLVEDEIKTANYLQKGLTEHGFSVETANNGVDGLFKAQNHTYDLLILDIMLPGLSGWDILEKLRSVNIQTPVLFLTAKDDVSDRVKGLQLGADDYLVKPFAFVELVARTFNILRRGSQDNNHQLKIADLEIDLVALKAKRAAQRLDLTAKEFVLLSLFARNEGKILSRTMIAEQVWDMNFDSDTNVVDVAIKRLRNKVDEPFDKKLIHTVRGLGYVFEAR